MHIRSIGPLAEISLRQRVRVVACLALWHFRQFEFHPAAIYPAADTSDSKANAAAGWLREEKAGWPADARTVGDDYSTRHQRARACQSVRSFVRIWSGTLAISLFLRPPHPLPYTFRSPGITKTFCGSDSFVPMK